MEWGVHFGVRWLTPANRTATPPHAMHTGESRCAVWAGKVRSHDHVKIKGSVVAKDGLGEGQPALMQHALAKAFDLVAGPHDLENGFHVRVVLLLATATQIAAVLAAIDPPLHKILRGDQTQVR